MREAFAHLRLRRASLRGRKKPSPLLSHLYNGYCCSIGVRYAPLKWSFDQSVAAVLPGEVPACRCLPSMVAGALSSRMFPPRLMQAAILFAGLPVMKSLLQRLFLPTARTKSLRGC